MGSIEKLLIYDATRSRSTTHVFIAHPSPAEDRALGQLGFVAELTKNERIYQELLSRLQDFLKAAYYTSPEVHADVAFEHTIQACNRYIGELVGDFGASWVDELSMVLFTVRNQEVHFADVGRLVGFLVHEKQVIDLLGNQRATSRRVNPMKLFASIASGTLKNSDAIFFGTSNLLDYFSVEKLRRTIVESPMGGAARELEMTLRVDPTHAAFAAVILQRHEVPVTIEKLEPIRNANIVGAPQRSMDAMIAQSAQTQAFLTPSLWPAVRRGLKQAGQNARVLFRAWVLRKPTRFSPVLETVPTEREETVRQRPLPPVAQQTRFGAKANRRALLKKIPSVIWERSRQALKATPKILSALQRFGSIVRRAPKQIPVSIEQRVSDVQQLPRRSRLLFYGTVAVAAIFALTLIGIGLQRNRSAAATAQKANITAISQAIDQAKSSIIYGDEDRARTLLRDAQTKLDALSKKTLKDAERAISQNAIRDVLAETRHAITTAPTEFATLPSESQPIGLTLLGQNLYSTDAKNNQLLAIPSADGKVQRNVILPGDAGIQELTPYGSGSLIALMANQDVIEQRPGTKTGTRSALTVPTANTNLVGLVSYNAALYTVDVANSTILRATKKGSGFTAIKWLKQSESLATTSDIAVDGSIYTVASNGEVQKFTQGRRVTLVLSEIEPKLTTATKLAGDVTLQNLYILDPIGKRVVAFTKNGKF
ncbi:MAG: hypothetical protein AAB549_04185, partial [Patescibacteria group bacterium]